MRWKPLVLGHPHKKNAKTRDGVENSCPGTHRRGDDVVFAVAVLEHAETRHGVYHVLRNYGGCLGDVDYRELKLLCHGKTKL